MKLKSIHFACAAALAALSSSSWAAAPGLCAGSTFDIDIYLTGASAVQNSLAGIIAEIISPGFTIVFDNGTSGTKGTSYRAYCGTLNNTTGALSGKTVRFLNRARGGSVWGVNPVARDQGIATLSFADADCVAASGGSTEGFDCKEIGNDLVPGAAGNRKPDFGVSDVEPQMFKGPLNVEFGQTQLTTAEVGKLTVRPGYQVIFGPGVTLNLGISTLSRTQVASLLTGAYVTWDQVGSAVTGPVTVCRRVQGSGTQASYNNYFLNFPCAANNIAQSGNLSPTRMADSAGFNVGGGVGTQANPIQIDPSAGPTTVENPASGDVRSCLIAAQNGADYSFKGDDGKFYKVLFSIAAGKPYGAIGVLSLDSKGNTGYGTEWTFAKLNGIDPQVQTNSQLGLYDFVLENTFQRNNAKAYPSADYLTFINLFITKAQSETILLAISNMNVRASVLAVPNATNPAPKPTNITSKWTRNANSCKPAQFVY